MFGQHLPTYLYDGLSSVGLFSLIYSLFATIFYPLYCRYGIKPEYDPFSTLSKEDLIYVPLIYAVYLYVIYVNGSLNPTSALVGLIAIPLPFMYRLIVYFVSDRMSGLKESCYYPTVVFFVSLFMSIPVTILYESVIYLVISYF